MQPESPMELAAMCEGRGAHKRSWKNSARHATNKIKSTTILHASYADSDGAWWRRCAAPDDDNVRITRNNQETQNYKNNAIKAPSLTTISNSKQQHKITSKNNRSNKHPAPSIKLTDEIQFFQMRKMDQRWRQRNATGVADAVACNVWGTGSAHLRIMKTARATQQIK